VRIPDERAGALEWLIFEQSGLLTTAQAMGLMSRGRLRHLLATKQWRRLCHGVLVAHRDQLTEEAVWWGAVLAAGPEAYLAGIAAATAGGLRGLWRARRIVDVIRPTGGGMPRLLRRLPLEMPTVKVHRTSVLPPEDRQIGRPPRTSMARSLLDAAVWVVSDEDAVSMLLAGCQQRLVLPGEVRKVADRFPRCHRHALIVQTLDLAELGVTSPAEMGFLKLCRRHRLPEPVLQVKRRDASGRTRYLDAYFPEFQVHVEIDGSPHMDAKAWAADMLRQNDLWVTGDRVLRIPAFLILTNPDEVVRQLLVALRAAGWSR
jgi:very-short-patch-repair endonuclease